jgi:undecaprenyl-diphosphatase
MSELEAFNRTMFLHINGSDDSPAWLIQVAIGLANNLIYLIPLLVVGLWLWGKSRTRLHSQPQIINLVRQYRLSSLN